MFGTPVNNIKKFGSCQKLTTPNTSNVFMRTDGFKKIVKGLSYKRNIQSSCKDIMGDCQSSIGLRSQSRQYTIRKKNYDGITHQQQLGSNNRRTKTAGLPHRKIENRQQQFQKAQKQQIECYKNLCKMLKI